MPDPEDEFNTDDAYEYAEMELMRREQFDSMDDEERQHRDDWNERARELM